MGALEIVLGIIFIVLAAALVICVLMQSGKEKSLSGSITGAGETFFAKSKARTKDKILTRATMILAIAVVILAVVLGIVVAK